ncbi:pseudouridine synthase [Spirochaetia bacterium]|nr:pseudouridine synthase [Spirochaetia bacterium]
MQESDSLLRLQVYLAQCGVASRRASETLITSGRVCVDGNPVTVLGTKVTAGSVVTVDGKLVSVQTRLRYILLNKPPGFLCSASDPEGRPLALDLLPEVPERLYNVGRLDYRSSGALIFSNDGAFAAVLGHPRSEIEKEYIVQTSAPVPDSFAEAFSEGITIDGIRYRARNLELIGRREIRVVLIEGKNREIRRVLSFFHLHPVWLCRIRIGPVRLGTLAEGSSRPLVPAEVAAFRKA